MMCDPTPIPKAERARFELSCRYIETHHDQPLPLALLAQQAGLSPGQFQRRFKAVVGLSPKQYQAACRLEAFKQTLRLRQTVTEALHEAGFGSASRVYEKLDTHLGMTPLQYRNGGRGLSISYATSVTRLGPLMMAATDRGLCFVQMNAPEFVMLDTLRREFPDATLTRMMEPVASAGTAGSAGDDDPFHLWMRALEDHLAGSLRTLDLPLDIQGTVFQRKVWHYLQTIPYGSVQSYTQVAAGIGHPQAVRAVATACAVNNLAIVIPCHRVIRGTGELAGFRWGLDLKRQLLEQESALIKQ